MFIKVNGQLRKVKMTRLVIVLVVISIILGVLFYGPKKDYTNEYGEYSCVGGLINYCWTQDEDVYRVEVNK